MGFTFSRTLEVNLLPGERYMVGVCDTKYSVISVNPAVVPGTLLNIDRAGLTLVYFKVSLSSVRLSVRLTTLLTVRRSNMSGSTGRRFLARRTTSTSWSTA